MNYKCIKEMTLKKYDDDCFPIENEYVFISVGSLWEKDDKSHIGGEVHLNSINLENDNISQWLEITEEHLIEHFCEVE